jgi:hypothetical protein
MTDVTSELYARAASPTTGLVDRLNTRWHRPALLVFLAVVLAHWAEHIVQAYQMYVLHWAMPKALGLLGLFYPWLIRSELLHYGYALVMLVGLWILRKGFTGRARTWWMISFGIQFWHHFEHALLLYQATTHHYFFGAMMPTSIGQIWIRRMELHLFYNTIVFIPMIVGMYYHSRPRPGEAPTCSCAHHARTRPAAAVTPSVVGA